MKNPVEIVKGWSNSAKRYAFTSVVLSFWLFFREDGLGFYGWTSIFYIPLILLIMAPAIFFMLAFTVDLVHRFIHWLEDHERLG